MMLVIESDKHIYEMSASNVPAASCDSGTTVLFKALDGFSGEITKETQLFSSVGWSRVCPATGPLYVNDAQPGDVLRVKIERMEFGPFGVMTTIPGLGALGKHIPEEKTKIVPVSDGNARFNDRVSLDLEPMIGVIGSAPVPESVSTGTPGTHGGNMDCTRIGPDATVYLPVNVPGALLAMGDCHAIMGDGEVVVCGVETAADITVKVDVLKGLSLPLPFVKQGGQIMTVAAGEKLDDAARAAADNMLDFLRKKVGLDVPEAGMILSLSGNLRVCQIVNSLATARMEFPISVLEQFGYRLGF
jgi:amidase